MELSAVSEKSASTENLVKEQHVVVVDLKAKVEELGRENEGIDYF